MAVDIKEILSIFKDVKRKWDESKNYVEKKVEQVRGRAESVGDAIAGRALMNSILGK